MDLLRPSALHPALAERSRKEIINVKWVESVDLSVSGGLMVQLRGGLEVEMSRRQSARLREILTL